MKHRRIRKKNDSHARGANRRNSRKLPEHANGRCFKRGSHR